MSYSVLELHNLLFKINTHKSISNNQENLMKQNVIIILNKSIKPVGYLISIKVCTI